MSISNYILNLLDLKDENIKISEISEKIKYLIGINNYIKCLTKNSFRIQVVLSF
ncbi:hypothetical protein [Microaceticoccus formicicus]|uniref:hypothetical protein n=1 Tax=Microaceticoccus formicicus TaxID=3118105 RepID=UPI003CCFFED1|nr:hypothetical protein VZL98_04165 [Peptoniphilaceae bacterium AMB_02]